MVEKLQNVEVAEVYCGGQFSVALSKDGRLFSWGKGEGWRLGHSTDEHIRFPQVVESLQGEYIVYNVASYFAILFTGFVFNNYILIKNKNNKWIHLAPLLCRTDEN